MGGGRAKLMLNTTQDPEYPELYGDRMDGRNLIQVKNLENIRYLSRKNQVTKSYTWYIFQNIHPKFKLVPMLR